MKLVPNLPSMDPSGMQMWLNAIQSENEVILQLLFISESFVISQISTAKLGFSSLYSQH